MGGNNTLTDTAWAGLQEWVNAALAFLYPEVCQMCRATRSTAAAGYVCEQCRNRLDGVAFIRPPFCRRCGLPITGQATVAFDCSNCVHLDLGFEWARSAVAAKGLVLEVIHRYKYGRALWFEPFLTDLMMKGWPDDVAGRGWDLVLPVPLHPLREREREFNQAERLARRVSREKVIPLNARLIRRVQCTRTQTLLSRGERASNMKGAFEPYRGACLNGESVLLVDDVLTTGATTSACAWVLRRMGARRVGVVTVARGLTF